MAQLDRLKTAFRAAGKTSDPLLLYRCMYRAKLKHQSSDRRLVDVEPEDALLPPMSNIPLRHGVPGLTVTVTPGATLLVGWENGKPNRPFAALWSAPSGAGAANATGDGQGGAVTEVVLGGATVKLGGGAAAQALIYGNTYITAESAWLNLLSTFNAAVAAAIAADPTMPAPNKAAVAAAATALTAGTSAFRAGAYLSPVAKTI